MERRRLAGMMPASLSHHRKTKKLFHSSIEDALFANMQGVFIHFHGQWQKRETNG